MTTAPESVYAAAFREPELHGPSMDVTVDQDAARRSVEVVAVLEPQRAITGHGRPLEGQVLRDALHALAGNFSQVAAPKQGRYVDTPVRSQDGSAYETSEFLNRGRLRVPNAPAW